jgi:hypothetical protein
MFKFIVSLALCINILTNINLQQQIEELKEQIVKLYEALYCSECEKIITECSCGVFEFV